MARCSIGSNEQHRREDGTSRSIPHQQSRGLFDLLLAWKKRLFEWRRVWHRGIKGRDDADWSIEPFECLFLDDRRQRLADAASPRVLVHDKHFANLTRKGEHRVAIQWRERSQIEHARLDGR